MTQFVRVGGLSSVDYGTDIKNQFHSPPRRRGIFAFIFPYVDPFLWNWKGKKPHVIGGYRKFRYVGYVWTHLYSPHSVEVKGSWYLIYTDQLGDAIRRAKKEARAESGWYPDPYRPAPGKIAYGRESFEVFIEKKYLGKVR